MNEVDAPEGAEEEAKATDGEVHDSSSVAETANEPDAVEMPEPTKLGAGQQTFPGLGRKVPRTHKVKIRAHEIEGAGEIKPEEDLLLVMRGRKTGDVDKYKEDGEGRVKEVNTVHQLLPTWVESVGDWLTGNGLKIVRSDGPGEALDPNNLTNIEEVRREREDALG